MPPFVHHPHYRAGLRQDHVLPINKFQRLSEILQEEGLVGPEGFYLPTPLEADDLFAVHDRDYVEMALSFSLPKEMERRIGLPMSEEIVRRARAVCGGTVLAADLALVHGLACNTAGGSHHAARGSGAGYCIFNDVALAAVHATRARHARQVLVVDLDVHQGDGTAQIFAGDPQVFTFSMHAAKNFPVRKALSDLDIALEDGVEDEPYLERLAEILPRLLDQVSPDLVFYIAGVDAHREDRLGRLALSDAGIAARDLYVVKTCRAAGAAVCGVLGGGYDKDVDRVANRHAHLHRAAAAVAALSPAAR